MIGNSQAGQGDLSKTITPISESEGSRQAQEFSQEEVQGYQQNAPFQKTPYNYTGYSSNYKGYNVNMNYMPQNVGNYYYNPQMGYQQNFQTGNYQNNQKMYNYNAKPKFKKNNMQFQYGNYSDPNHELNVMQSLKYVSEKYPNLININADNIGLTESVKQQQEPRFFVIKSFTEEDIHKVYKFFNYRSPSNTLAGHLLRKETKN